MRQIPPILRPLAASIDAKLIAAVIVGAALLPHAGGTWASREPLFDEARLAVLQFLRDPETAFYAVRMRNVEYKGKSARVVCGYAKERDAPASVLWIYVEPDHAAFILTSKHDTKAVELIFEYCQ